MRSKIDRFWKYYASFGIGCRVMRIAILLFVFHLDYSSASAQSPALSASTPLKEKGDLSSLMVEGIDRFLTSETNRVQQSRAGLWHRDFSSAEAFNKSISVQRDLLARQVGVVDARATPEMNVLIDKSQQFALETKNCTIRAVSWKVLDGRYKGLYAEGLLLQPKGKVIARVVMIPDADVLPEVFAGLEKTNGPGYGVARRFAEAGWEVIVPVLVSREETFSGSDLIGRFTNQPHREWLYRQAFVLGRHVIGYELQKVFAAIDWFESRNKIEERNIPIGVAGYGEGGLLALHAAALDERISCALVSGYFNVREQVWSEPIYRNVFGSLKYFGNAELAVMAWPRRVIIEHSTAPEVSGPPVASNKRWGAAPGRLSTPNISVPKAEWNRAKALLPADQMHLRWQDNKGSAFVQAFSPAALSEFASGLNVSIPENFFASLLSPLESGNWLNITRRQERTVRDMEYQTQRVLALSERTRDRNFWQTLAGDTTSQQSVKSAHRQRFWDVIGRLPTPSMPANPRVRTLQETEKWTSYEVMLDVWPEVFAWGILLIPKDIQPGEKRPAVVCQHGLEGLPLDVVTTDPKTRAFEYYQGFAVRLAERGYVVFAPHNPYRGGDKFRVLQRKANPIGLSLFSVITGQHQRIVEWLAQQSFIDPGRIGFYGLSYGGKTAMRVPALVEGYALSICSADFNEWVRKNASTDHDAFNSYMFTNEYEMPEWDLGHTFNYAEMAALIAPRPFMVERGHYDQVGTDEWVAYEFAKVRRHYDFIGLPGSTLIEYFNGPHSIHGKGTFEFLDHHLKRR
ncbi:MAG: dienelactone hydrolase family protein [Cyclobacteriaceae bacterium]